MTRRGLALLLVAGVLGVLASVAAAFATLARLERRASAQRVHATRAWLLARAGLESAQARLDAGQDADGLGNAYRGEDRDGDGQVTGLEAAAEVYQKGAVNLDDCPLGASLAPSFYRRHPTDLDAKGLKAPDRIPVDGRDRGCSGTLPGGAFALRIRTGGFFLNGGDPAADPGDGYNAVLRRILGTLADALGRLEGKPLVQSDGWALVDARPAEGWKDAAQVRAVLGWSPAKLEALLPYLAFEAWTDRRVIRPNATTDMEGAAFTCWADIRRGAPTVFGSKDALPATRSAPDFERIAGVNVGRAPVPLSWARRRRPALVALLAGLRGLYLDESHSLSADADVPFGAPNGFTWGDWVGKLNAVEIALDWSLPADECRSVADRILTSTSDLGTWARWNAFCDSLNLIPAKRDLLKANFNPNSRLNKFNPNRSTWSQVDKMDLRTYSTEFCLDPIQPVRISCLGRTLDPSGRVLAAREASALLAGPSVFRMSTQREFVCEDLGDPAAFGDETGVRLPGASHFLSEGTMQERTWGHRLHLPGTWMDGDSRGAALQSYPEPCTNPGSGLGMAPADFDGSLQLATVETPSGEFYGVPSSAHTPGMSCLARWDDRFDLDVALGPPQAQPDAKLVTGGELAWSVLASKPNTLYPDGCYLEREREMIYLTQSNLGPFHGLLSFWMKRNYDLNSGKRRTHSLFNASHYGSGGDFDQAFMLADDKWAFGAYALAVPEIGILFETASDDDGQMDCQEFFLGTGHSAAAHRWELCTVAWDFQAKTQSEVGALVHQGSPVLQPVDYMKPYSFPPPQSLTTPDKYGEHRMILGGIAGGPWKMEYQDDVLVSIPYAYGSDVSFDEFAVWDFGGYVMLAQEVEELSGASGLTLQGAGTQFSAATLAANRFKEGRYYKGWLHGVHAGTYATAPIRLPAGSRIGRLSWTWMRPQELPDDYPEVEVLDAATMTPAWGASASRSGLSPGWTPDLSAWRMDRKAPASLRLRVGFCRATPVGGSEDAALDTPILDSPVLDDLTLTYTPEEGRRLLEWGKDD